MQPKYLRTWKNKLKLVVSDGLECGGAYLKLLQENKKLKTEEFSNASPYVIMFGPDKCGATNKVTRTNIQVVT